MLQVVPHLLTFSSVEHENLSVKGNRSHETLFSGVAHIEAGEIQRALGYKVGGF